MTIAVSVVREQQFSAQTLVVRGQDNAAPNPQLHIFPYVTSNPSYITTLTSKANVMKFHSTFYLCIALCKADFTTVALKHERNPGPGCLR